MTSLEVEEAAKDANIHEFILTLPQVSKIVSLWSHVVAMGDMVLVRVKTTLLMHYKTISKCRTAI